MFSSFLVSAWNSIDSAAPIASLLGGGGVASAFAESEDDGDAASVDRRARADRTPCGARPRANARDSPRDGPRRSIMGFSMTLHVFVLILGNLHMPLLP